MTDQNPLIKGSNEDKKTTGTLFGCCSLRGIAATFIFFVLLFISIIYAVENSLLKPDNEVKCTHVVVGAGWAGVYYAWRLVFAGVVPATDFCIFEASTTRVGGRIASIKVPDIWDGIIEMGGYRFDSGDQQLVKGVIVDNLKLNTSCYEPGTCEVGGMKRITGTDGQPAGYLQGILGMLSQLKHAGAKDVQMGWELVALQESNNEGPFRLRFRNGESLIATSVLLNLPPTAVKILRSDNADGIDVLSSAAAADPELETGLYVAPMSYTAGCKHYLFYEDAWWVTILNLTTGVFLIPAPETPTQGYPPAEGRYFDGQVQCKSDGMCRGSLLFTYSFDASCFPALLPYAKNASKPEDQDSFTILKREESAHGNELLDISHRRLMDYHGDALRERGVNPVSDIPGPYATAFALWDNDRNPKLPTMFGMYDDNWRIRNKVSVPIPGRKLYIANEGYALANGWAEPALVMVERILSAQFAVSRPNWVTRAYWQDRVIPNLPPATCTTDRECESVNSDQCTISKCTNSHCTYIAQTGLPCSNGDECLINQTCTEAGVCGRGFVFSCNTSAIPPQICRAPKPRSSPQCMENIAPFQLNNPCTAQSPSENFELQWELINNNETIQAIFSFPGLNKQGWYAMGVGKTMIGADIIVGYGSEQQLGSTVVVQDRYSIGYATPLLDEDVPDSAKRFAGNCSSSLSKTWMDFDRSRSRVRIYFERPLDTNDPCDVPITLEPMHVLYAWVADTTYPDFPFHALNRGSLTVDFGSC